MHIYIIPHSESLYHLIYDPRIKVSARIKRLMKLVRQLSPRYSFKYEFCRLKRTPQLAGLVATEKESVSRGQSPIIF